MTQSVTVSAPAKINLSLGVGPLRADGFHPLATVFQAIGLFDEVRVRPAESDILTVYGDGVDASDVPTDGSNIALKAARLLAKHHSVDEYVEMHIHKRIPVAGGLAGGSADAAAALVACDALWGLRTPRDELLDLAAELGSDVPFCVVGGTAIGLGRGEVLSPVMSRGSYWWVVVPGEGGLSTPSVYAEFDRLIADSGADEPEVSDSLLSALRAGDVEWLGTALSNDLQRAALSLQPDLAPLLEQGLDASAHGAIVSGSGPTTVFLCESREHALEVGSTFDRTVLVAEAPVHGARVVSR
ncbi:MAG TPA: 4-(cytidine 5'-diphospho)-2-C-methyl-D-erythritol kinase [Nocardioidaceae bacterium]|nr:4-(cytidine 5'-diphospho)-2-C-methyl-D-erythritol kinase [Nocardioidaceae bacterium]